MSDDSDSDISDISPPPKKSKTRITAESENDSNEELDEVEDNASKRKRRMQFAVKDMFHDEAEVDEDDEEEDEEYEDDGELIGPEDDEALDAVPAARELDSRRRIREIMDQDEEEIERYYQERYESQTYVDRFGDGEAMADSIVQKERLPGIKDPNLWALRCKMGEEKATVLAMMRKFIAYQNSDTPLQIKSAFAKEGLNGYIYVEAFKQTHVKQAIDGITALRLSQYKQQLVPISEMTEVMRVVKESGQLKADQWVRIRSGMFRDDLAQVEYIEDAQNLVTLKLLPRIDYDRKRNRIAAAAEENDAAKTKRFKRPAQALFDPSKALDRIQRDGSFTIFESNRYDSDGFLHKQFRISAVLKEGIRPTLTELERFHQTPDNMQLAAVAANTVMSNAPASGGTDSLITHCFTPGDVVEVCEGDLKNLRGKVVALENNNRIIVQPNHSDLHEPIPFTQVELRKFFNQGDHVKVLSGRHINQTGLVIRFEPSLAVVLSDHSMDEMKVAPKDLRLWQDSAVTLESSGHVQLMDLVQVDPQTVGVVVSVERDRVSVLTCFGKTVNLKANTALRRLNTQRRRPPQALDRNGNVIQLKQAVRLLEKPHAGLVGEVKHLYRSWAFIYSRTHLEDSGLVVTQTRQLAVLNSTPQPTNDQQRTVTPISGARTAGMDNSGGRGGRGGAHVERKLIGKTARIVKGTLKGLLGIICDATPTHVVLELHSQFKKVPVARENVALLDSGGRIMDTQYGAVTPRVTPMREMRTPQIAYGAQTPHAASTTPRGDSTPLPSAFNAGMATPRMSSNLDDPMTPSSNGQVRFWDIRMSSGSASSCRFTASFEPGKISALSRPHLGSWLTTTACDPSDTDWFVTGGGPRLGLWNRRAGKYVVKLLPDDHNGSWYPQMAAFSRVAQEEPRIIAGGNSDKVYRWDHGGSLLSSLSFVEPSNARIGHVLVVDSIDVPSNSDSEACDEHDSTDQPHPMTNVTKARSDSHAKKTKKIGIKLKTKATETNNSTTVKGKKRANHEVPTIPDREAKKPRFTTTPSDGSGKKLKKSSRSNTDHHKADIWFEDVAPALIAASREDQSATTQSLVKSSSFSGPTRRIGIDCEFVGVGFEGKDNALARVSIVNQFGHVLLDSLVRPIERVIDYRTKYSGIRPADLRPGGAARTFHDVHREVAKLCKGRVLIGHSIGNDLKVLMLSHPRKDIRDTSRYRPFRALFEGRNPSLRALSEKVLGVNVQQGEHDSIEDARATMRLYTSVKRVWESKSKNRPALADIIPAIREECSNEQLESMLPSLKEQVLDEYDAGLEPLETVPTTTNSHPSSRSAAWDNSRNRRCSKRRDKFIRKRCRHSSNRTKFQSAAR